MKNHFFKHLVILATLLSCKTYAQLEDQVISLPITKTSVQTAATINDFLQNACYEEMQMVGKDAQKPGSCAPNAQDLASMNYDALIQACISQINKDNGWYLNATGTSLRYIDGQVKFFDVGPSTTRILTLSFFSLCGLGLESFVIPYDRDNGVLAAKIAALGVGTAFGVWAAMELRKKIKMAKESPITFNREGLLLTFEQSGTKQNKLVAWSTIKSATISRAVELNIWDKHPQAIPLVEHYSVELRDENNQIVLAPTTIASLLGISHYLELVSFYRGQALSIAPDSLPITVTTEISALSKELSKKFAYCAK